MTAAVLLAAALLVPGSDPREVVASYLDGLKALDQDRMDALCAPGMVSVGPDGSERTVDRESRRRMREFEREMHTSWTYRIEAVEGERVTVELFEHNDFYELLGVGRRAQEEVYVLHDGLIRRAETRSVRQEHGDYATEYARFKTWLMDTPAATDARIVRDGGLIFDAESAKRLRPWLERWKRGRP